MLTDFNLPQLWIIMFLYKLLGFIFLGIAGIGVFLPLLPTTPFLLLSAGCFAKSSSKWHQWLLSNRTFGPIIRNWHDKKCISFSTKMVAFFSIFIFGGYSILFSINNLYLKLIVILLLILGLYYISSIRVCRKD